VTEIAVVRALNLGDMLCAVPALRSLRAWSPDATITLIGLPWAHTIVERFPMYLDRFLPFAGFPGIPEVPLEPERVLRSIGELRRRRWDLVVQLHGAGTSINEFVALLGGRRHAGFLPPGQSAPTAHEDDVWLTYPDRGSEVDRLLALAVALGGPDERHLEFPVTDHDHAELAGVLSDPTALPRPYAVIHPGGSTPGRRWPAERFAVVADELAEHGLAVALTGTIGEASLVAETASRMRSKALALAGRTSLGAVAALIHRARIVVTNDTGISHLSAAIGTDSVTIFSASDRERWAPVGDGRHMSIGTGIPSSDVPQAEVLEAVGWLLEGSRAA
jgi:ADP-heptose:LPS heptosyltransferase